MSNLLFWYLVFNNGKKSSFIDAVGVVVALLLVVLALNAIDRRMDPAQNGTPYFSCRCNATGYAGYTDANSGESRPRLDADDPG